MFNGTHPETGEDLVVVDEAPEGFPPNDLPPQEDVFAPDYAAEEIARDRPEAAQGRRPAGQGDRHRRRPQRREHQGPQAGQGLKNLKGQSRFRRSKPRPRRSSVLQPEPAAAVVAVGRREPVARELDHGPAQRLGRERDRLGAHVAQPRGLGVAAVEQVERGRGRRTARRRRRGRCSRSRRRAGRRARCRRRPRSGDEVSIAPPQRWVKRVPSSCGNVWKKCWASVANVGVVLVVARADRAAVAVDRVPAAVQDPVVGGQPVVVELVAAVADALAVLPADRATGRPARSPARSRRPARRSGGSRAAAADRRWWRAGPAGADAPGGGQDVRSPDVVDRGVLVDAHAGADRGVAQAGGELAGVEDPGAGVVPDAAAVGRGGDLGAHRRRRRAPSTSWPKRRSVSASSSSHGSW